jgi:hypothetical protein
MASWHLQGSAVEIKVRCDDPVQPVAVFNWRIIANALTEDGA